MQKIQELSHSKVKTVDVKRCTFHRQSVGCLREQELVLHVLGSSVKERQGLRRVVSFYGFRILIV